MNLLYLDTQSPVWEPETNTLYFVDVLSQRVHRLLYDTGVVETNQIQHGQVNFVCLIANSSRLLVAVTAGLYLIDKDTSGHGDLRLLTQFDVGLPDNVLNEGKADARGRFWAGTKGLQSGRYVAPDMATLYSIDEATYTRPTVKLRPITISNGLTWYLNNSVLYFTDSATKRVDAFDYNLDSGDISNRRTILDLSEHNYGADAIPGGLTIDSDGNLWVALMFGGKVLLIDPDIREVKFAFTLPASQTTSVCWGGPGLEQLYVTSSQTEGERLSGALFVITNTGRRGVSPNKFIFKNADNY